MSQVTGSAEGWDAASRPSVVGVTPVLLADDAVGYSRWKVRLSDVAALTKLRITVVVVMTAAIGFFMAARGSQWAWLALLGGLAGTALCCMGASAFNQVYERDTDGLMRRTSQRPLPAGRLSPGAALWIGVSLTTVGIAALWLSSNALAAGLAGFTVAAYAGAYTPLKRRTPWAVWVGAVPGAMPPVIGAAAATGRVGIEAALLFAVMFIWQLPHFLAIAWLYRQDYARAGLPILGFRSSRHGQAFRHMVATCVLLLAVGTLPAAMGVSGWTYASLSLLCGLVFLGLAVWFTASPSRFAARLVFLASLMYLPVVLTAMLLDQVRP